MCDGVGDECVFHDDGFVLLPLAVFACYDDVFVLLPLLWLCLPVMMRDKFSAGEVGPAQVIKSQQNSTRLIIIH